MALLHKNPILSSSQDCRRGSAGYASAAVLSAIIASASSAAVITRLKCFRWGDSRTVTSAISRAAPSSAPTPTPRACHLILA